MNLFNQVKFLLKKEILLEWRSKYAFNGVLLYVVSTVFVCYIAFQFIAWFYRQRRLSNCVERFILDHLAVCICKRHCQKFYAGKQ